MFAFVKKRRVLAFLSCALSAGVLVAGLSGAGRLPHFPPASARRLDSAPPALVAGEAKILRMWVVTEEDDRLPEFLRASRARARYAIPDRRPGRRVQPAAVRWIAMHGLDSVLNL